MTEQEVLMDSQDISSQVKPSEEHIVVPEGKEKEPKLLDELLSRRKKESAEEEQKKVVASPIQEDKETMPTVGEEKRPENVLLEKGFATMEAQIAYYAFIQAIQKFDVKTGKGALQVRITMDMVKDHVAEMSLDKLFSIVLVLFGKVLEKWTTPEEKIESDILREKEIFFIENENTPTTSVEKNSTNSEEPIEGRLYVTV